MRAPHARMGAGGREGKQLALASDTHWMFDLWRVTSFLRISAFLGAKLSHWTVNHEHITQWQVMHFVYTFRDDFDFGEKIRRAMQDSAERSQPLTFQRTHK